jgi:hypothetical protein
MIAPEHSARSCEDDQTVRSDDVGPRCLSGRDKPGEHACGKSRPAERGPAVAG